MEKRRELTERAVRIIRFVEKHGPCLVGDIAAHLKAEPAHVRSALRPLIEARYLKRRRIDGLAEPTLSMGQRYHVQKMLEIRLGERALEE